MQVMPFWREEIGRPEDNLHDIRTNLLYGCRILAYYLEKEKGDRRAALARYNGSRGQRWYPDRVFSRLSDKWYRY
jgi:soluble lytic murein transglycosylase-like protein